MGADHGAAIRDEVAARRAGRFAYSDRVECGYLEGSGWWAVELDTGRTVSGFDDLVALRAVLDAATAEWEA